MWKVALAFAVGLLAGLLPGQLGGEDPAPEPEEPAEPELRDLPTAELIARLRAHLEHGGDGLCELAIELEDRGEAGAVPRNVVRRLIAADPPDCRSGAELMATWESPFLLAEVESTLANPARRSALRVAPRLALAFRERGDLLPAELVARLRSDTDPEARIASLWLTLAADEPDWAALASLVRSDPAARVRTEVFLALEVFEEFGGDAFRARLPDLVTAAVTTDPDAEVRLAAIDVLPALGEAGLPLAARLARDSALPEDDQQSVGECFVLQGRLRDLLALSPAAGCLEGATRALRREECERWLPSLATDLPELARQVVDADQVASILDTALKATRGDIAREILVDGRVPLPFRKKAVEVLFPGQFGGNEIYGADEMPATAGPARDVVLSLLRDGDAPAAIRTEILTRTSLADEAVLEAVRKIARKDPSPWLRTAAKERLADR